MLSNAMPQNAHKETSLNKVGSNHTLTLQFGCKHWKNAGGGGGGESDGGVWWLSGLKSIKSRQGNKRDGQSRPSELMGSTVCWNGSDKFVGSLVRQDRRSAAPYLERAG
ncbi:hypothetical protein ElyMa_003169200 [Elysia marginata]|uniref:Uncharacterized protein n=1 Tax=Elysia marginata TaxID=1093978 RepID=A0AAV4J0B7_9GAST|nr:hypothetical protein ElyMa_003169200 [Elysia marginata]